MAERRTINTEVLLDEVRAHLAEGKRVRLRVKGKSMHPFILEDDMLVLAPAESLRKGDIVLARINKSRYVVHRIIGITNGIITLMGDGNLYGREECRREDIFGIALSVIHNGEVTELLSVSSRLIASVWRSLLPFRRIIWKIKKYI
ncbi:MAG: S24 family peptidase [Muribaculaceae bacterium]|nr:S24 family peptidase [Muribaculaceae bacterium]